MRPLKLVRNIYMPKSQLFRDGLLVGAALGASIVMACMVVYFLFRHG